MPTGHVKFYKAEKGFGFITPDNGGPGLFWDSAMLMGDGARFIAREQSHGAVPAPFS